MKNPIDATSPLSSPAAFRTAAWGDAIPSVGAPRAYSAIVFVGAWNASGVRVPSTREQHDTASRCAGCP
jgi:hypothetical protein